MSAAHALGRSPNLAQQGKKQGLRRAQPCPNVDRGGLSLRWRWRKPGRWDAGTVRSTCPGIHGVSLRRNEGGGSDSEI